MSGERTPGDGWVDLDNGRYALELRERDERLGDRIRGVLIETTVESGTALAYLPGVTMEQVVGANGGERKPDGADKGHTPE